MQKERMTLERAKKNRKKLRWWRQNGNYIAAAVVFFTVSVLVIVMAASMTTNGQQATPQTKETSLEEITLTAGAASVLPATQNQPQSVQQDYESMVRSYDWDGEEAEMLLKIAMAEAEGESTEGKALVMLVVLNRTWSDEFPGSIEAVIFQDNPARQFTVTAEGGRYWTTEPDEDCVAALRLIESGWDKSYGAMYFESCKEETTWHSRNLEFLFQLGNHKFYK